MAEPWWQLFKILNTEETSKDGFPNVCSQKENVPQLLLSTHGGKKNHLFHKIYKQLIATVTDSVSLLLCAPNRHISRKKKGSSNQDAGTNSLLDKEKKKINQQLLQNHHFNSVLYLKEED